MTNPTGETKDSVLRIDFDRRLRLQFRGPVVTSDAGLLAYQELDDALGLTYMASEVLADARTGKNRWHALAGLFRQSVFGRLDGYEDGNDAEPLRHDPVMRWVVGGRAAMSGLAPASRWAASRPARLQPRKTSARSPTFRVDGSTACTVADRQGAFCSIWIRASVRRTASKRRVAGPAITNARAIIRCSCSTSSAIWNAARCVPATSIARTAGTACSSQSWRATKATSHASISAATLASPIPTSTTISKPRASNTSFACRRTGSCKRRSAISWLVRQCARRMKCAAIMRASAIRLEVGIGRRVVAKVEWHPGELCARVGFIVRNMARRAEDVVAFCNKRGTCEQWIKEGKGAISWTRLPCRSFAANAVRLQLDALAYNLCNFLRALATREPMKDWSLTTLKEKLIKIGAKVDSYSRYVAFLLAEVAIPRDLFSHILQRIAELRPPPLASTS